MHIQGKERKGACINGMGGLAVFFLKGTWLTWVYDLDMQCSGIGLSRVVMKACDLLFTLLVATAHLIVLMHLDLLLVHDIETTSLVFL